MNTAAGAPVDAGAFARVGFLRALVLGVPALALAALVLISLAPRAWAVVLALDLWLLSFPHVASTFTRTAFRRADAREHRWVLFALPPAALALCLGLVRVGGVLAFTTVYFFWQTLHYTRQSRGILRALRRSAGRSPDDALGDAVVYLVAVWSVVHRCGQGPQEFFGFPLWVPTVSRPWEIASALAALGALGAWVWRLTRRALVAWNPRDAWHLLYLLSHVVMFLVGYVAIDDASHGWLAVNLWHNAQYLLFAWAWSHRRFTRELSAESGLLSQMARQGGLFFVVCAILGAAAYLTLFAVADAGAAVWVGYPLYLVLVHTMNFQHYLADMVLWRSPSGPPRTFTSAR